ncbi:MAG: chemotaxis-specific protein-glutamate methyltransferase CheB [Bacteriovoracaceae bacterium]
MPQTYNVKIGEVIVSSKGTVLQTTLGSCVSVCLFDPVTGVGGMIHCASPLQSATHSGRNCSSSLEDLFYGLSKISSRPLSSYKAKVVGGANEKASQFGVGEDNVKSVLEILKREKIEIVGEDTGGTRGRTLLFFPSTGKLKVSEVACALALAKAREKVSREQEPREQKRTSLETPKMKTSGKTKVFIIDDSKTIQVLLKRILSKDTSIEVVGVASDPIEAMAKMKNLSVDVLTLDINMPKMNGMEFLKEFMPKRPMPVVLISALSLHDGNAVLNCLELGAVDYIQKPKFEEIEDESKLICEKIISAGTTTPRFLGQKKIRQDSKAPNILSFRKGSFLTIGASTGGTEAIKSVLTNLPANIPPTVIVQHIPPVFSKAFADRVNGLCPFLVKEAEDGEILEENKVLIAPGGKQMKVRKSGDRFYISITDDPPVNRHRPSVDYLFHSVAKHMKRRAIGALLTGMGEDGAKGLLELKEAGCRTLAQDEESSVVFGMPREAIKLGAAQEVASLDDIPEVLIKMGHKKNKEAA